MAAAPQLPEAPPGTTLAGIPDDVAVSILLRIPCKYDRASMSLVCKAWRDTIARLSARSSRPQLPLLLLPSRSREEPAFRAACVLSGCCVHPQHGRLTHHPLVPGARFVGSYDGAWIFLHYGLARAHALLNLRTRQFRDIPSWFVSWKHPQERHPYVDNMFILAATLSSSPDDHNCIGAAIVAAWWDPYPSPGQRMRLCLVFWRMGSMKACEMLLGGPNHPPVHHLEDVVYHDGAFHVLVNYGDYILVCTEAEPASRGTWAWMKSELQRFRPHEQRVYAQYIRARYIVQSRGEMLKVIRLRPRNQPTSEFKVFQPTRRPQMPDAEFAVDQFPWEWTEMDTLGGRILFVGYGCSRSYDADQYPGFKAGIYFLDDGRFYEDGFIFRNHDLRPYPCSDNGKWSDGRGERDFPTTHPSDHSPPAWLLL